MLNNHFSKKLFLAFTLLSITASVFAEVNPVPGKKLDVASEKKFYGEKIYVEPMNGVSISKNLIVIAPEAEGICYTISGYFKGQIVSKTKNTELRFNTAFIENSSGEPAVYGERKTEISTAAGTVNYILSYGKPKNNAKNAALQCRKNLELGGSGTLYAVGMTYHGIKADGVKIKGSGKIYAQGTAKGAALSCEALTVEKEKKFTAWFLNSKSGIKADETIGIASGTFHFYGNGTALKTDTSKDLPNVPHGITLSGGTFVFSKNEKNFSTEDGAFSSSGAKTIEQ